MNIVPITLEQVLLARDERVKMQAEMLRQWKKPLVCFTMNIAGPVKRTCLTELAFQAGVEQLLKCLGPPCTLVLRHTPSGSEAFAVFDVDARSLKQSCVCIEEETPVGRLYDLDVIGLDGKKLSREGERKCIVCGGPAAACARSRAHGLEAVEERTQEILREFAPSCLAALAVQSLREEVHLTPKPGLVDERNCGAHTDMDLPMFERSAEALRDYFRDAVQLGMMKQENCMGELQPRGIKAEQEMLAATGGVNTHKGAVYLFGLLLAAMGSALVRPVDIFAQVSALAKAGSATQHTHGAQVREKYGAPGARQEAIDALPHLKAGLRVLQASGDALKALLAIMSELPDTNVSLPRRF
jgi:holo-ACP synthase/triphosphoribosyl-dephospho-CoA synthase